MDKFLKQPIKKCYKVPISEIRYDYKNENAKKIAIECIFFKNEQRELIEADTQLTMESFNFVTKSMKKWEERSKKLNGWGNLFFSFSKTRDMCTAIKDRYKNKMEKDEYKQKKIKFMNIHNIYNQLLLQNPYVDGINRFLFSIWVAASKVENISNFKEACEALEILAKNQAIYCIANYKSRKNRAYFLPWDCPEHPVNDLKRKYIKRIEKRVMTQINLDNNN